MSFFGSLGKAALSIGGAAAGAAANVGIASHRGKTQWSRQKRMMQNRHQWEVDDLRAAGLNPILSAGAAPSMASPGLSQDKDMSKPMDQVLEAQSNKAQRKLMKGQRGQMASVVELNTAGAAKHRADASNADASTRVHDSQNMLLQHQLPAAAVAAEIAKSDAYKLAQQLGVWTPHLQTLFQGIGAYGVLRLGGRAAMGNAAARNKLTPKGWKPRTPDRGSKPSTKRFTTGKMQPAESWINPKRPHLLRKN